MPLNKETKPNNEMSNKKMNEKSYVEIFLSYEHICEVPKGYDINYLSKIFLSRDMI